MAKVLTEEKKAHLITDSEYASCVSHDSVSLFLLFSSLSLLTFSLEIRLRRPIMDFMRTNGLKALPLPSAKSTCDTVAIFDFSPLFQELSEDQVKAVTTAFQTPMAENYCERSNLDLFASWCF
jgi:hypothetical protein